MASLSGRSPGSAYGLAFVAGGRHPTVASEVGLEEFARFERRWVQHLGAGVTEPLSRPLSASARSG